MFSLLMQDCPILYIPQDVGSVIVLLPIEIITTLLNIQTMLQSIASTANPSEACNAGAYSAPIDPPQSKYVKTLPNSNSIPFDPSIIQSIILSDFPSVNVSLTIHGRCFMSWQRGENVFWGRVGALTTHVGARGVGTKCETCRPVDVGDQKSNYPGLLQVASARQS